MSQYLFIPYCKRMHLVATHITTLNKVPASRNPVLTARNVSGTDHYSVVFIQFSNIRHFEQYIDYWLCWEARY